MFGEPRPGKVALPSRGVRVQRPIELDWGRSASTGDEGAEALVWEPHEQGVYRHIKLRTSKYAAGRHGIL